MDSNDIIRLSLIASGTAEADTARFEKIFTDILTTAPPIAGLNAAEAGETLLEWMHEDVLTRYVESQTRLDTLLANGLYNCVSSAVFYAALLYRAGLDVEGVLTSDHAFCRIPVDTSIDASGGIDVETTTPYGFDPGTRREAVDEFSGRTGFSYVPPGNYSRRRAIDIRELISLIYQNRMAALQRQGQWTDTVGLARDRWEMAGTSAARNDFITSLNNYAAEMDRLRRQEEALEFLWRASEILGEEHGLEASAQALLGNGITYALRAGNIEEAEMLAENQHAAALVPAAFIDARKKDIALRDLETSLKSDGFDQGVLRIDQALAQGLIDQRRWGEFTLFLWSTEARGRAQGGKWLDAWLFLLSASEEARSLSQWNALEDSYAHNAAVIFHNSFADALSRGDRDSARQILNEALEYFPDDPTLQRDADLLNR